MILYLLTPVMEGWVDLGWQFLLLHWQYACICRIQNVTEYLTTKHWICFWSSKSTKTRFVHDPKLCYTVAHTTLGCI